MHVYECHLDKHMCILCICMPHSIISSVLWCGQMESWSKASLIVGGLLEVVTAVFQIVNVTAIFVLRNAVRPISSSDTELPITIDLAGSRRFLYTFSPSLCARLTETCPLLDACLGGGALVHVPLPHLPSVTPVGAAHHRVGRGHGPAVHLPRRYDTWKLYHIFLRNNI